MSVTLYKWDGTTHGDPQVFGRTVEDLRKRLGKPMEGLSAKDVVDEAREKTSPIHPLFDWDDRMAGEKWRECQARHMLRSIRVVFTDAEDRPPMRAHVAIRPAPAVQGEKPERLYVPSTLAAAKEATRLQMLGDAIAYLRGAEKRLAEIKDIIGLATAAKLLGKAVGVLEKIQSREAANRKPAPAHPTA